jgi:hypothetical protein
LNRIRPDPSVSARFRVLANCGLYVLVPPLADLASHRNELYVDRRSSLERKALNVLASTQEEIALQLNVFGIGHSVAW